MHELIALMKLVIFMICKNKENYRERLTLNSFTNGRKTGGGEFGQKLTCIYNE